MLTLALILGLSVFLAACGKNDATGGKSDANGKKGGKAAKVTLNVVSEYGGTDPATKVFQQLLDDFQKDHPNVTIKNNSGTASTEFNTKLQTQWSAGDIPDLTFFFGDSKGAFIQNSGKVIDVQQVLDDNPDWAANFQPSVLEGIKKLQNGHLYTIPVNGYYEGLIVNKKLFKEAGLELPKTWDQFKTAVKTFAKQGKVIPIAASMKDSYYLIENFVLAAAGADGHSEALKNMKGYEDGLNLIKETYEWNGYPKDSQTIGDEEAQNYYKKGQAAMIINGSWVVGGLPEDVAANSTVLPMPVPPNGKLKYGDIISGFSSGWYVSKAAYDDAKKKEATIELLKYVTSKDAIQKISQAEGAVPAVKGVTITGSTPAISDGMKMASEAGNLEPAADGFISADAYTFIRTHVPQIVVGQEKAKDVLKQAKALNDQAK